MGRRVLIVDDERRFRNGVAALLERRGYEVARCASIRAARRALGRFRPNLVVLETCVRQGGGGMLFDALRELADRPILLVYSGLESFDAALEAIRLGADGFVGKSRGSRRLAESVAAHLGAVP